LILASQREWLIGFKDTFIGSKDEEPFTNAKKRQIGFCKTVQDFEKTDICLSTFAQFMSEKGKKKLAKIKNLFGLVLIDEVHLTPALQTSRVVAGLNPTYMYGLSGTVERKVTMEINIAHDLIGPTLHTCKVERLIPRLTVLNTHVKIKDPPGGSQAGFTYFQGRLQKNSTRRDKIITEAIRYAEAGHMVLLPLSQVDPILDWTREINSRMGKGYALPFYGGLSKEQRINFLSKFRKYQAKICVGNISLISTGTNIPRASCIFEILAMNNGPKCGQRLSRILTPYADKPEPVVVLVIDDSKLMRTIRRAEFWGAIKPRFSPKISSQDMGALMAYFKGDVNRRELDFQEGF
jgi:superfamily II DNA or RNA helicase